MFGLAWLTLVGFQTVRDVMVQHRAPLPSEYVASSAFFIVLALIAGNSDSRARVATVLAWGIVIAIVLEAGGPANLVTNGLSTDSTGAVAKTHGAVSGGSNKGKR